MKCAIIYYTGTFNTRYLVNLIINGLYNKYKEIKVDKFEIDYKSQIIDLNIYDLIIISYPIYGFNIPHFFLKYLKKLTFIKNKKYIIAKQSGECYKINNTSSRKLLKLINSNDVKEYHFLLPYNIHFRFADNFVKQLLIYDDKLLEIMLSELEEANIKLLEYSKLDQFYSFFVSIQSIGGPVNSLFYKVDESKCLHCNKCLNACPNNNIYIKNGKIKFHHHCLMCMRCSFYCPKDCIKIGLFNSWKVNGEYNLEKIKNDPSIKGDYIKEKIEKGFYSCYYDYFKEIDEKYQKIKSR
ncbi:MAG: EFR1 family ferrodoxin [Bacilli bacterium]